MERTAANIAAFASHIAPTRGRGAALSIRLSAAIGTATVDEPRVLTVRIGREPVEALPSGPLEVEHRTLEVGLRAWVERQTSQKLGYVERLYTFGDRDRTETGETRPGRALTVAYLALVREARQSGAAEAQNKKQLAYVTSQASARERMGSNLREARRASGLRPRRKGAHTVPVSS